MRKILEKLEKLQRCHKVVPVGSKYRTHFTFSYRLVCNDQSVLLPNKSIPRIFSIKF